MKEKKTLNGKQRAKKIATVIMVFIMTSVFLLDIYTLVLCNKYEKEYTFSEETFDLKNGNDRIHFLNTANSDCILIESNGHFALVDSGEGNHNPRKKTEYHGYRDDVINYLKKVATKEDGKVHLDFILGTHCHYDHYGNFEEIIKNDDIVIDKAFFKVFDRSVGTPMTQSWPH